MRKQAKANVNPIRQSTQYSCVSTSTCMALSSLGVKCTEEDVNKVIGAKPMRGARWEEVLACAQYFGCRATLTTPSTLTQVKEWTDQGKPVLIAWNPEGRDWSHASLIFDVTGEKGNYLVHIADPNMPNPDKTVREVGEDDFYGKWYEKWPDYLVRRPALMIEKEITPDGRQVMASLKTPFSHAVKEIVSSIKHLGYLTVIDQWSTSSRSMVFKISVPGFGQYSLDFDFNLKSVSLYEGTRKIREINEISKFPEIIRHLPPTTSKMASALLPCTQEELGLTDREMSDIWYETLISTVDQNTPIREHALQIAEFIPKQKIKPNLSLIDLLVKDLNSNMIDRVASKYASSRTKPRTLQGGTIKVPIRGGHVLISKWVLDHIMKHNEIGTGSVFSRGLDERTLIGLVQKAPIKGNGGLYTMKASNVGYNLVLPMDEAMRLPDATMTMIQKEERDKKIDVVAVETSAPLRSFQTNLVTLIVRPSNPKFLPDDAKRIPAILEEVREGRSYSVLTAFPGDPDIPPSSQWGGRFAVVIPK